jgi:hypothetical protein
MTTNGTFHDNKVKRDGVDYEQVKKRLLS